MKGRWFVAVAALVLLGTAAVSVYLLRRTALARHNTAAPAPPAPPAWTGSDVVLDGRIRAVGVTSVPVPLEGAIEAFYVEVGDEVYETQLLAQLRSEALATAREKSGLDLEQAQSRANNLEASLTSARLEASRAEAAAAGAQGDLERAEKAFERQKLLLGHGATPRLTYEKAEREFQAAKDEAEGLGTLARTAASRVTELQRDLDAARTALDEKQKDLEQAEAQVAAGEVHSPVNGVIVGRRGVPGDQVDRSMTDLFQIATDLSRLEVAVEPPPTALPRVKPGQSAAVTVAESAAPLEGRVKSVENGWAVVEFANPDPLIKPGLTAKVRIVL